MDVIIVGDKLGNVKLMMVMDTEIYGGHLCETKTKMKKKNVKNTSDKNDFTLSSLKFIKFFFYIFIISIKYFENSMYVKKFRFEKAIKTTRRFF